jgi:hypothetical protein
MREPSDVLKHPFQWFTPDRRDDLNVIASANVLTIAIDGSSVRFFVRDLQQDVKKLRRGRVVVLPVTEKFLQILLQKPVEITHPV